jgi:hypothetical protein
MANLTSYQSDVRPLFTERDIQAMSKAFKQAPLNHILASSSSTWPS